MRGDAERGRVRLRSPVQLRLPRDAAQQLATRTEDELQRFEALQTVAAILMERAERLIDRAERLAAREARRQAIREGR